MTDERNIPTPNPATSVSCMKITPLLKPFEGDATVTVTVNRDPAYTGPVTVQIRNNGSNIASLTLESPDEEEIVSLLIPAAELSGCENKLEACAVSMISTPCCPDPIPASLNVELTIPVGDGVTFTLKTISATATYVPIQPIPGDPDGLTFGDFWYYTATIDLDNPSAFPEGYKAAWITGAFQCYGTYIDTGLFVANTPSALPVWFVEVPGFGAPAAAGSLVIDECSPFYGSREYTETSNGVQFSLTGNIVVTA